MKPNDESTLEHAAPFQVSRLLALAATAPRTAGSLPATVRSPRAVAEVLREIPWPSGGTAAEALDVALREDATLEALRAVKETSKSCLAAAKEERARDALTFLYHLSIAAAYAAYGANLSSRAMDSRVGLYEDLASLMSGQPAGRVFNRCLARLWQEGDPPSSASG